MYYKIKMFVVGIAMMVKMDYIEFVVNAQADANRGQPVPEMCWVICRKLIKQDNGSTSWKS